MRIRWRDFEIPNSVICEDESRKSTYGKFYVEPFERGFGITVGNSLRRILLSSLEGAALVYAKIEGVQHEFTSMTGVYEDVTDVVLNLKNVLMLIEGNADDVELKIRVDKAGDVTAGDIEHGPEVTIVNPDLHIAKLTQDIPFNIDLRARKGRGYATAPENRDGDNEIGVIWMDSSFSPVSRVRYKTENTRVGQLTNYDRLILEIWTNGALKPEMALVEASKILRKHLNPFIQYSNIGAVVQPEEQVVAEETTESPDLDELRKKLEMPISALTLGVRAYNCLDGESIRTVGQLVAWKEPDLLRVRNFGQTTLDEIKAKLVEIGLDLGMEVPASISVEPVGLHISAAIPQDPIPQDPIPQDPLPQDPLPQDPLPQDPMPQDPMPEYQAPIPEEPQVPAPDFEAPVPGPADAGDSDAEASVDTSAGTI
ncbi:MAG: DNA-directed RNA polymerase subunit alpha [Planctomycetota bacterium]